MTNTVDIFWSRVDIRSEDECWLWLGGNEVDGYGRLSWKCQLVLAHRLAYHLAVEPIQLKNPDHKRKSLVLHECDVRACCNPKHLYLGDHAANMADKCARGRAYKPEGELHCRAHFSNAEVLALRARYIPGCRLNGAKALSTEFGIPHTTMWSIVAGKSYRALSA